MAVLPFELCRTAHPDGPYALAREGSTDLFPRTAIIPHLEQRCLLFWCPFPPFNTPFLSLNFAIGGIWSSVLPGLGHTHMGIAATQDSDANSDRSRTSKAVQLLHKVRHTFRNCEKEDMDITSLGVREVIIFTSQSNFYK
jgi:hypothetical protein